MAYHCVFRPMVCLERTRTKTERFNRVILKLKEQLAGWPMGFLGPATGQSRVTSLSGLSCWSRSTTVAVVIIGRPGDAFHCRATTPVCSRCPSLAPTPLPVGGSRRSLGRVGRVGRVRRGVRCSPVFVIKHFLFVSSNTNHLLMMIHFQPWLTLNYRSFSPPCTTESCGLSSGTGCTSPFFSAPLPRPTSSVSHSTFSSPPLPL